MGKTLAILDRTILVIGLGAIFYLGYHVKVSGTEEKEGNDQSFIVAVVILLLFILYVAITKY